MRSFKRFKTDESHLLDALVAKRYLPQKYLTHKQRSELTKAGGQYFNRWKARRVTRELRPKFSQGAARRLNIAKIQSQMRKRNTRYAPRKRRRLAPLSGVGRGIYGSSINRNYNSDKKWHTVRPSDVTVDDAPFIFFVNDIANGADVNERIGSKVCIHSLYVKMSMALNAVPQPQAFRCTLVWDKQPNGLPPVYTDVYEQLAGAPSIIDHVNMNNRDRFIILWEQVRELNIIGGTVAAEMQTRIEQKKYLSNKELITSYKGTTAAIGDIATGSLIWIVQGTTGVAAAANLKMTCNATIRMRYTDM